MNKIKSTIFALGFLTLSTNVLASNLNNSNSELYIKLDKESVGVINQGVNVNHRLRELNWVDVDTKIILSNNINNITVDIIPEYVSVFKQIVGSEDQNAIAPYSKSLNNLLVSSSDIAEKLNDSINKTEKAKLSIKKTSGCKGEVACRSAYSDYLVNLFTSQILDSENLLARSLDEMQPYLEAYDD